MERLYITTNYAFIPAKRIKKRGGKVVPTHTMKADGRSRGTATLTLSLGTIRR
jgi:hypothetical protein